MVYTATLTKTGQITIPKPIRAILGIEPGEKITFHEGRNAVRIDRAKTAAEIAQEIDALIPDEARAHHMKEYAGMTSAEIQEKWLKTPDAVSHFKEEEARTV